MPPMNRTEQQYPPFPVGLKVLVDSRAFGEMVTAEIAAYAKGQRRGTVNVLLAEQHREKYRGPIWTISTRFIIPPQEWLHPRPSGGQKEG